VHPIAGQGLNIGLRDVAALAEVLVGAARSNGAEIRTRAPVQAILLQEGCASGVRLANGEEISGRIVASSADPRRTFFDLVGPTHLAPRFMREVRNIIYRGSTAKVNLALKGLPSFRGQDSVEQLSGHIRICPSLTYLERACDDAKYGRLSAQPMLDMVIPTLTDPTLAPEGGHVMSIRVQYAPYALRGGTWEEQREALGDLVVQTLARYAPGIREVVEHRQVLTPLDLEQRYGLTEGSIFQGQMGLDQLLVMRPVPGWSQYRTPIEGLYLCGAGTHPGGGVTGAPGYNAAREILRDLEG
jgi:phytoene dehydrogenase-like protein